MLRKALIWLRKEHKENLKNHLLLVGSITTFLIVSGLLIDYFLPFKGLYNVLRSIILVLQATGIFVLGYHYSLTLHYQKMEDPDIDWTPYRLRFSVSWRRKIAICIAALIFVFMYGLNYSIGYTLFSSLFVSILIALVLFIRPTKEEQLREELEIPDVRDIQFKRAQKEAARRRVEAAQRKKARRGRGRPTKAQVSRNDFASEEELSDYDRRVMENE